MSYCVGEAGKSVVLEVPEEKAAVLQEHTEKKEKEKGMEMLYTQINQLCLQSPNKDTLIHYLSQSFQ